MENPEIKAIVAVDLGTGGTGVTFCFTDRPASRIFVPLSELGTHGEKESTAVFVSEKESGCTVQAAGVAAAICARNGVAPKAADPQEIRRELREIGAYLPED